MYAHASLIDGFADSPINKVFFNHNDIENLEYFLKRCKNDYVNKMIVVEGVYSMDGDIAPLDKIVELARKYKAWVLVDEAHATGVLGEKGHGTVEMFGLEGQIDIVTGTFSKALGCIGGFVAGKHDLIKYLQCSNRSFIFSTSPFVPAVAAILEGLDVIENELFIRRSLWFNIYHLREGLKELGFNIGETNSPIIPIIIGDSVKVVAMSNELREEGIYLVPITYPVVARDKARLRISVTAEHTRQQIKKTLHVLARLGLKYNCIKEKEFEHNSF
jgi:glycine C-acetyltransferase